MAASSEASAVAAAPAEVVAEELRSAIDLGKIRSLEALRGLAALGVVTYHWTDLGSAEFLVGEAPFSVLLLPFYKFGWVLVSCLANIDYYAARK